MAAVLIVPGYGDSGPDHWQTLWQRRHGYARVEQDDWLEPQCADWIAAIDRAVQAATSPVVFVAHSLGCAAVVHWAPLARSGQVAGALLVALADVESAAHTPDEVRCFAPLPLARLPFRSIVVASTNDPFMAAARARTFATAWGADFVDVGALGHVNADSGIGDWPAGHALLAALLAASGHPPASGASR